MGTFNVRSIALALGALVLAAAVLVVVQATAGRPVGGPFVAQAAPVGAPKGADTGAVDADALPVTHADLNVVAPGVVTAVLVSAGDAVKKDQVLLRLDSTRESAAVEQAQAAVDRVSAVQAAVQATLARSQAALALLKAGPRPEDVATAQAVVNVAQAQLARAQAGADTTTLATAKANMEKAARAVQEAQAAYDRVKNGPFGSIGPDALRLEQATIDYDTAKTAYEQLALGPREVDLNVFKAQVAQALATLAQVQAGARAETIAAAEADVAAATANAKASDADLAAAKAVLKQAQGALANTELRAPFDGTVVSINLNPGETQQIGSYALRLADLTRWKIRTRNLPELKLGGVQLGAPASITFDAIPGLSLSGKVTSIDDFAANHQFSVEITPDSIDPRMRWNMTANVTIQTQ